MATPLSIVPAPWTAMQAEAYTFLLYSRSPPSSAAYDPLERASSFSDPELSGAFVGGIGAVMIVRYKDTKCGAYDELVLFPGSYEVPVRADSRASLRITRIYVSTIASTYNGRLNWNIPKRLAEFKFIPRTDGWPGYSRVEVKLPGTDTPFFAADFTPSWLSMAEVPISSTYLPISVDIHQPPLPEGEEPERVGTKQWRAIRPWMRGKVVVMWGAGGLGGGAWANGVDFPEVEPVSLGVYGGALELDFPEACDPASLN